MASPPSYSWSRRDPAGSRRPTLLQEDAVHVWCAAIDVPASRVQALATTLTLDERSRADGFRFRRDRDRFVVSRGLLRVILARYLDASPTELRFRYGPYGKPGLDRGFAGDLRFNLAHAQGLGLFAVAVGREIGIDVEEVRSHSVDDEIAALCFSSREHALLQALSPRERQRTFLRFWTRKEAWLKAVGSGLSMVPAGASPTDQPMAGSHAERAGQRAFRCSIWDFEPAPGYVAALAVEGRGYRLTFGRWTL